MKESRLFAQLPPEQQAVRENCYHPTGKFIEFMDEEVEQSIGKRFGKIAAQYSDRIAIRVENYSLTYKELDEAATRIGGLIVARQSVERAPVALLFEHGAQIVTAILGVLKTGNIYVPLDPTFPSERTKFVLDDSDANLIVTNTANIGLANSLAKSRHYVLNVDDPANDIADSELDGSIGAETLACIIYTSGSTGLPKGVMETHRNLLHRVMIATNSYHISAEDRLAFFYSCSFSASARCMFGALLNGAMLLPYDVKRPTALRPAEWLLREGVTIYFCVPTLFRHVVQTLEDGETIPSVRLIPLGSEPVVKRDVELFNKHFSRDSVLVNSMATGETGTVLDYFIANGAEIRGDIVPVGYPARGKEVFLLDQNLRPITDGQVGQIAVRSRYLSPGYWKQKALTEAAYAADPEGGKRPVYLSGDLGRVRPDGSIEHLGRNDSRVKFSGAWIEIAAIESALMGLEGVAEAAVVAVSEGDRSSLIAYVVPKKGSAPAIGTLRQRLAERLPLTVTPSRFMLLERLPLTPTGKVDRRALPKPDNSRPKLDTPYVAPKSPIEIDLAKIWVDVLSLDEIGIHDNFFELGGHSLAATRIVSRVIGEFHLEIPLRSLFQSPTVAEMALVVGEHHGKKLSEKELDRMLREIESLTDAEAQERLSHQSGTESTKN